MPSQDQKRPDVLVYGCLAVLGLTFASIALLFVVFDYLVH